MCHQQNTVALVVQLLQVLLVPPIQQTSESTQAEASGFPVFLLEEGCLGDAALAAITEGFKFCKALCCGNQALKEQLEVHKDFLGDMLGTRLGAVNAYVMMCADNSTFLLGLHSDEIRMIVDWLCRTQEESLRGARFVELLNVLTHCDGAPLFGNQLKVLRHFVKAHPKMSPPLKYTENGACLVYEPYGAPQALHVHLRDLCAYGRRTRL